MVCVAVLAAYAHRVVVGRDIVLTAQASFVLYVVAKLSSRFSLVTLAYIGTADLSEFLRNVACESALTHTVVAIPFA